MRRLAHGLGSAGQDELGISGHDSLRRLDDGFEPGAAKAIDGDRGCLDPAAGSEGHMAGQVWRIDRGLRHITDYHVIDLLGPDPRPGYGLPRGNGREVGCRQVPE